MRKETFPISVSTNGMSGVIIGSRMLHFLLTKKSWAES